MKHLYSIYIHIPYCISKCAYCDFYSMPFGNCKSQPLIPESYIDALVGEIDFRIKNKIGCKSIYIGGGTPSLLSKNQLLKIINILNSKIEKTDDFEFTIEANPDDISVDFLEFIYSAGITRISCGIQSLNDISLKKMNRRAGREENLSALEVLKNNWKGILSLDLIAGLPEETEKSFVEGLNTVISINPQHISLYSLTIEEETPLGQQLESGLLKYDYDAADEMWLLGRNILLENGYNQYEISNFSKKGFECIHNTTYWMHEDYLGFGSGATGTEYSGYGGIRRSNTNNTDLYIDFWNNTININEEKLDTVQEIENLTAENSSFEFFMMGLRTSKGISSAKYKEFFSKPIPQSIISVFNKWEEKGLLKSDSINSIETNYSLTNEGMLFLNTLLQEIID